MNKDRAEKLKHLSCCLLETLDQSVIAPAVGELPEQVLKDLNKAADSLYKFNQKMVKESK